MKRFEQDNEQDLLDDINERYHSVAEIKVEAAKDYAGSIRAMLESAVKYFYLKKYDKIPVWVEGGREQFTIGRAIHDSRFEKYFNEFTLSDMDNIRKTCNVYLHSPKKLSLEDARDMLERIEKCIHRIEDVLQIKIICGLEVTKVVEDSVTKQTEPSVLSPKQAASIPSAIQAVDFTVENEMSKGRAIRLLQSKGYSLAANRTFASKNRRAYNYWANPEFLLLKSNWSLILNDWISKKLYLFTIPANSIKPSELTSRSDKDYLIDLQILYADPTFTDSRSGYRFAGFLTAEVDY